MIAVLTSSTSPRKIGNASVIELCYYGCMKKYIGAVFIIFFLTTQIALASTTPSNNFPTGFKFTSRLAIGSSGSDVLYLQKFLNTYGFTIALSGEGSLNNEGTDFGPLTQDALFRFQRVVGIVKYATDAGAGILGPKTRAAINTHFEVK